MNARNRQLWIVAGIILVLILSACGSSTSGGGSSSRGAGKSPSRSWSEGSASRSICPTS